jgi:hypothetical protein
VSRESDKAVAHHQHTGLCFLWSLLFQRLRDVGNRFHAIARVRTGRVELVFKPGPSWKTTWRGQHSFALIKKPVQGAKLRQSSIVSSSYFGFAVESAATTFVNVPFPRRWNGPPSCENSSTSVKVFSEITEMARLRRRVCSFT